LFVCFNRNKCNQAILNCKSKEAKKKREGSNLNLITEPNTFSSKQSSWTQKYMYAVIDFVAVTGAEGIAVDDQSSS
jgi:uncharacterized protein YlxW (UPF0749 family)